MAHRRLCWRSVSGLRGRGFAPWVRTLAGRSGAYIIRQGTEWLYVGESHTGRLYDTLTRHFQAWRGRGAYSHGGRGVGPTFERRDVQVAVILCPPNRAIALQNKLLARQTAKENVRVPF